MTLIYQDALLAGDVLDDESGIYGQRANPNNPIVCYKNFLSVGMATADSEQENFSINRALNDSTREQWKSDSLNVQNIDFDLSSVNQPQTAFCVAAHNLAGAYVRLLVSSTQGSGYSVVIPSVYVETNRPLMFCFEDPSGANFFRFEITPFVDKPIIGYILLGQFKQLQRRVYVGHTPIVYGRKNEYYTPKTADGNFPGRIKKSTRLEGDLKQEDVTPDYFRAEVAPFLEAIEGIPFFFAWRPQKYPLETALCWTKGNVIPTNARPNGWMDYQIGLEAHNPSAASSELENFDSGTALSTDFGLDLSGTDKYFYAAYAPNGKIYAPPQTETEALIIDTINQTAVKTDFGLTFSGNFRYSFTIYAPNGKVYCIPLYDSEALIIDTANDTAVKTDFGLSLGGGTTSKFGAAILAPNGKIYCIPFARTYVLIIDTADDTAVTSNFGLTISGASAYNGAVLADNGKIYCVPYRATDCLIIDTADDTAVLTNFGLTMSGGVSKWVGGALADNGKIYCAPYERDDCLVIDTSNDTAVFNDFGLDISSFGGSKYRGAIKGRNGKIYFLMIGASQMMVVQPSNDSAVLTNFGLAGFSQSYYSGVLHPNGKIYFNPFGNAEKFLIVDTNSDNETAELEDYGLDLTNADSLFILLGYLNRLYTMPRNEERVIVVTP